MTFQIRDCTRQVELLSFIEKEKTGVQKSGWYNRRYFSTRTTEEEKIELRHYMKDDAKPLFYTGACEPPHKVRRVGEEVMRMEYTFPTIKAEATVGPCDVDEFRIRPDGTRVPVGSRVDEAIRRAMMPIFDGLAATQNSEAITILKYGRYILRAGKHGDADILGTVDFKKTAPDADTYDGDAFKWDFSQTEESQYGGWNHACARPFKQFEMVLQHKARCGAAGGVVDVIYSQHAWNWMELHSEKEGIKYRMQAPLGGTFDQPIFTEYSDVFFRGQTTHGNMIVNHFVDSSKYWKWNDTTNCYEIAPTLDPGEVLMVCQPAFGGTRLFRTISPMEMERLPAGTTEPWFLYDDPLDRTVFDPKAECYTPWMKEYHLMIPRNVDAAQLLCVVDPAADPCKDCWPCEKPETVTP